MNILLILLTGVFILSKDYFGVCRTCVTYKSTIVRVDLRRPRPIIKLIRCNIFSFKQKFSFPIFHLGFGLFESNVLNDSQSNACMVINLPMHQYEIDLLNSIYLTDLLIRTVLAPESTIFTTIVFLVSTEYHRLHHVID